MHSDLKMEHPADTKAHASPVPGQRLLSLIILIGWGVSALLAVAIVIAVIAIEVSGAQAPSILESWGGIIIGFYFGQFASFMKDYLNRTAGEK